MATAVSPASPAVRRVNNFLRPLQGPLIAIGGAILIGAGLMLLAGHNPLDAYWEMLLGAIAGPNLANLASTLARGAPIVGMGIAAAIAFRAGFANLGGEGQMVLGALTAALVGLYVPLPAPVLVILALVAAMGVGGVWAWLPAWAQFRVGVPLLISTLLLNYPASYFASYMVTHVVRDVPSGMTQTYMIPDPLHFPKILSGTQLHVGIFITLAVVLLTWFVIARTVVGYRLRMMGLNAQFTRYGGVNMNRLGYGIMFASGAIAGLVGAIEVLGVNYRYIDGALQSPQYAWVGLMAALLVNSSPLGVLLAGLFFSAVQTGGFGMERATDVPRELARVLQALIILLIAAQSSFNFGRGREEERET
ncbi:MAG TPA: ABC transporter permease [Anaerolineae bacterium]|nr:ABC transporter permease [Anaerolineae bacterium]